MERPEVDVALQVVGTNGVTADSLESDTLEFKRRSPDRRVGAPGGVAAL
jgi:hypothetical protein